ncbi:CGNR zinc finger domain-containing protein [Actinocorallia sp. A-T 12471]|uniref:CGNR zinc finger domain-containing protein n=1 Tax=Actinocorallia sp. A-T 12471 TaxID=3089813 RepID=UPI0029CB7507|nr:CGNR zinc finger domain-containing protein [Actinocorallia sp. A-T 12471]MDX6744403.1 CGNR zinc finger domain-containing protein [Actinocorallia sp. A-T 12471]
MIFPHDTEHALEVMVDLVNSAAEDAEGLADLAALAAFVEGTGASDVPPLAAADLAEVRALRARFREVFDAAEVAQAVPLINGMLAELSTAPYLTDHDGHGWHVHYFAPGSRIGEHLAVDCGMALAYVLAAGELDRLRQCAADGCDRVLVDLSRNRCRRFCDSRTCGNRAHVAAYRARRRAG